jgi:ABC-type sugar transport system ATPase subunit
MNIFPAQVHATTGCTIVSRGGLRFEMRADPIHPVPDGDVILGVRAENIALLPGSAPDGAQATIDLIEPAGHNTIVEVIAEGERLRVRAERDDRRVQLYKPGDPVRIAINPAAIHLFDPVTGRRLV